MQKHDCEAHTVRKISTKKNPYHFVESGLPNVFLVGVHYSECVVCGTYTVRFKHFIGLMERLKQAVIESIEPLTPEQIRFLRKMLRKSSKDFAKLVGVSPEQVSRWMSRRSVPSKSADRLIRILAQEGTPVKSSKRTDRIVLSV